MFSFVKILVHVWGLAAVRCKHSILPVPVGSQATALINPRIFSDVLDVPAH